MLLDVIFLQNWKRSDLEGGFIVHKFSELRITPVVRMGHVIETLREFS